LHPRAHGQKGVIRGYPWALVENTTLNSNWKKAKDLVNLATSAVDLILRDRYEVSKKPLYVELGTDVGPGAARTT